MIIYILLIIIIIFFYFFINDIKNLNKFTWINILSNVLFFMLMQTLFFIFIASSQYNEALKSKISFITDLSNYDDNVKKSVNELKDYADKNFKETAQKDYKIRMNKNNKLLMIYCYIPITITTIILLMLIFIFRSKKKWSIVDTYNILLILLSYLTELYFFFFVIKKYELIGDHTIIYNFLKKIYHSIF